ncbi:MAG: diguanylate cyclase (GGDEF)-like protein/PAS domain S-box-containing protein [Pseudomonadales bacterium]|jgi:diguanylate cyclase (GGDEF)-like protein/PAS domain S-box-containing protein
MPLQFLNDSGDKLETSLSFPADLSVGEVVQSDILYCSPDTQLNEAAAAMQERQCSSILVMVDGHPAGIWTERDTLSIDFEDPSQFTRPISQVMSKPVATIRSNTMLRSMAALFQQNKLRHFLVVDDDDKLLGILSQTDVVEHQMLEHYLHLRTVGSVVRKGTPRLPAESTLMDAVRKMQQRSTDAILVSYPDDSYGILTERDLVRLIAQRPNSQSIGELASRPLQSLPHDMSLYRARNVLTESGIRHVGVTSDTELLGLVSFSEIMSDIEVAYVRELQDALQVRDCALSTSRRNLQLAERIIENTLEGVIITDLRGRILSVNPAFTKITGYTEAEVIGKTPGILSSGRHGESFYLNMWRDLNAHGHWQGEIWNRKKNGELLPEYLSITTIHGEDGQVSHYAAMFNDITKLKASEESIRNMAYRDPLTDLPNRRLLDDRLDMAIAQAHRHGTLVGVIFIDLDHFKHVNDSLGHGAGDELLVEQARRLELCVRENDTVARLGGDEFVIVLSEPESVESVRQTARRIMETVRTPLLIQGRDLVQTCSLGISVYPDNGVDRETLLKHADGAMYDVKSNGRDGLSAHAPVAHLHSDDHLTLMLSLRQALENGEIQLYYQPLMDSQGQLAGAEALLRWHHPKHGFIPPESFISLAEESGLIIPIGDFVLRQAAEQIARWQNQGLMLPEISINVSGRQLRDHNFINRVKETLEVNRILPAQLVFELTESVLMDKVTGARLQDLKDLGVSLALDDFGTGYAALIYLRRFPLDRLKIDRSFVRDMLDNAPDAAIVSALIRLAKELNLQVVAEGVEKSSQFDALRNYGSDLFQGYLFAPALPATEFEARFLISEQESEHLVT